MSIYKYVLCRGIFMEYHQKVDPLYILVERPVWSLFSVTEWFTILSIGNKFIFNV